MSIRTALIPSKHVRLSDSIIGLSGYLRPLLSDPRTLDELWVQIDSDSSGWNSRPSFPNMVLAVEILYAIGLIKSAGEDRLAGTALPTIHKSENRPVFKIAGNGSHQEQTVHRQAPYCAV